MFFIHYNISRSAAHLQLLYKGGVLTLDFKPNKKLGFGLMRMPTTEPGNDAAVDVEQVKQMVDLFIEHGFTHFDTAWMYNGFASEGVSKKALVDRYPRESFTLATKLHAAFFDSLAGRDEVFRAQLEKTGAGYFRRFLSPLRFDHNITIIIGWMNHKSILERGIV